MANEAFLVFTSDQALTLEAVLNSLIPPEGEMPGAGDLGIASFVDKALAAAPHLRRHILGVVDQLSIDCWRDFEQGFPTLPQSDKVALLQRREREQGESFSRLVHATYAGYYSHPSVVEALGAGVPSESESHLRPFDPQLLDNVLRRGPVYKDI